MAFPIMILAELALKVASKAIDKKDAAAPKAVEEMAKAIAADPVLKNEMNAEPAYQSRVVWGSVFAALGVVVPPIAGLLGFNVSGAAIVEYGGAVVTLAGAGYALYGRLSSGLKPLFSKG